VSGQQYFVKDSYPSNDRWLLLLGIIFWLVIIAYTKSKDNKNGMKGYGINFLFFIFFTIGILFYDN
jgi:hypothetical protein